MKIHRIDHVGVIVNDLPAAKTFFLELGLQVLGEKEVQSEWIEGLIGLPDARRTIVWLGTSDGQTALELVKYHTSSDAKGIQQSFANTFNTTHIAFAVEDIEAIVAKLKKKGAELVGEIQNYENAYKLCFVRGPEGIILELAEKMK